MKKVILCFIAIGAALVYIYWPVLEATPVLRYDDVALITPLQTVHNFSSYLEQRKSGNILDIQPVRDVSYILDNSISQALGYNVGHLTNIILWYLLLIIFYGILILVDLPSNIALVTIVLYGFHPIFVGSVAWLSARKHLLSAFFILSLTTLLLREIHKGTFSPKYRSIFLASFLYLLACFSHPINILWPASALILILTYRELPKLPTKKSSLALFLFGGIATTCAYLNQKYYFNDYIIASGVNKYANTSENTLIARLLAFGKYVFQVLVPIDYSPWGYTPNFFHGLLGVVLFLFCTFIALRLKIKKVYPWLTFFIIALAPVIINMTNIFASDTYLITSGMALAISLSLFVTYFLKFANHSLKKTIGCLFGLLCVLFICISASIASSWVSDIDLAKAEFERQETARSGGKYISQLLVENHLQEATQIGLKLLSMNQTDPPLQTVLSKTIYMNPQLTIEEKFQILDKIKSPWSSYYRTAIHAQNHNTHDACESIKELLKFHFDELLVMQADIETIAAESYFFCKSDKQYDIANRLVSHLKIQIHRPWNESKFQTRLLQLSEIFK